MGASGSKNGQFYSPTHSLSSLVTLYSWDNVDGNQFGMVYYVSYGTVDRVSYRKIQLQMMLNFEKLQVVTEADVYLSIEFAQQSADSFKDVAMCKVTLDQDTSSISYSEAIDAYTNDSVYNELNDVAVDSVTNDWSIPDGRPPEVLCQETHCYLTCFIERDLELGYTEPDPDAVTEDIVFYYEEELTVDFYVKGTYYSLV